VTSPSVPRPFLERHPEALYWLEQGLRPNVAKALVKAGYRTLADLAGKFREDLVSIRGLGKRSMAQLEALLGSAIPSRTADLAAHGIHPLVRHALDRAGIRSMGELALLTREQFLSMPGFGETGLRHCKRALGRPLDSPVEGLQREGLRPFAANQLAAHGVRSVQEIAGRSDAELKLVGLRADDIAFIRRSGA
jgi:DNA-directed RNA polymerase alpha subunit